MAVPHPPADQRGHHRERPAGAQLTRAPRRPAARGHLARWLAVPWGMVRSLLLGLAALVVVVVLVSILVHALIFGLLFVLAAAVSFAVFRVGRRPRRSRP